jgi:hypothetical protein
MGTDLSTLLIFIATAFGGNIESLTFSIGGEDDRTYSSAGIGSREAGRQLGLDGHSRCEGDISALRRDFFTNNGGKCYTMILKKIVLTRRQSQCLP